MTRTTNTPAVKFDSAEDERNIRALCRECHFTVEEIVRHRAMNREALRVVRGDQVKLRIQTDSRFPRTAEGFLSRHPHTKENYHV